MEQERHAAGGWVTGTVDGRSVRASAPRIAGAAAVALLALLPSAGAAAAGQNGSLAFASDRSGNFEVYAVAADGSSPTNLTAAPGADTDPAWSPDAARIAFVSDRDGNAEVYAMNADGSGQTDLTGSAGADTAPSWSPDGARLAFVSARDGNDEIYVMNADGSGQQDVSRDPAHDGSPAWSSDGSRIAFASDRSGNREVYTAAPDGSRLTRLTNSTGRDDEPSWSPDGTRIVFVSSRDGNDELYTMNADGSAQTRLTSDTFAEGSPSWSPDGTQIAYTASDGNDDIYVAPAAGGPPTRLTTDPANDRSPTWSSTLANASPPAAPSGPAVDGSTLTAATGTWVGITPITYSFDWRRCSSSGDSCTAIDGATARQYVVATADVGTTLRVLVTAANARGRVSVLSAATAVVAPAAPVNTAPPVVTGPPAVGAALIASTGAWSGTTPLQFSFQWERCPSGGACASIAGATASGYSVAAADAGNALRVVVTATNSAGSATATSASTAAVTAGMPANTAPPTVVGSASVGATLTATPGTWLGSGPLTYAYAWQRCNVGGAACTVIAGAAASSYAVADTDVGATLRVAVTATNGAGTATATSNATPVVVGARPENTAAPSLSGTPSVGAQLTARPGSWRGSAPITFAYAWYRCASAGSCSAIAAATASTYRIADADRGAQLKVDVTATNPLGTASAASPLTDPVEASTPDVAPTNTKAPKVSGRPVVGSTLTASRGTWRVAGTTAVYEFAWQRCSSPKPSSCKNIARATAAKYRVGAADVRARLRATVTAASGSTNATAVSAMTAVVTRPRATSRAKTKGTKTKKTSGKKKQSRPAGARGSPRPGGTRGTTRVGTGHADVLVGTAGPDRMSGRGGNDVVYGGPGNDRIDGGAGHDRLYGGTGDDRLMSNDGTRDVVDCGPGRDQAEVDGMDILSGCELVRRHTTALLARWSGGEHGLFIWAAHLLTNVSVRTSFESGKGALRSPKRLGAGGQPRAAKRGRPRWRQ